MNTKSLMVVALALLLLGTGAFYFLTQAPEVVVIDDVPATTTPNVPFPANAPEIATSTATTTRNAESVLGISAGGTEIKAYHFGTGSTELLFIGGIHGGYSANTTLVAYELMNHLKDNPELVPKNVTVTVIPAFNADGLMATVKTTGVFNASALPKDQAARVAGRFNKNTVDLNRNFDCEWEAEGTWQNRTVSGGGAAFSEPEAAALRDYVATYRPTAVVAWYSAAGGVFASNCGQGVSSGTTALMNTFAKASGYPAYASFDYYEITGDMMNWFAKLEVPAVSVLLSTHEATEWEKNRRGIEAVLASYAE